MEQISKKSICGTFDHNVQAENVKISELQSKSIEDKGVLVTLIVRPNPPFMEMSM